jgi:hypothetical protein
MIVAQCLSFLFDKPFQWRYVQLVGAATAIVLAVSSFFTSRADRKSDRRDTIDERGITEESSLLSERGEFINLARFDGADKQNRKMKSSLCL